MNAHTHIGIHTGTQAHTHTHTHRQTHTHTHMYNGENIYLIKLTVYKIRFKFNFVKL